MNFRRTFTTALIATFCCISPVAVNAETFRTLSVPETKMVQQLGQSLASKNLPIREQLELTLKAVENLREGKLLEENIAAHSLASHQQRLKQLGFFNDDRYARNALAHIHRGARIYGPSRLDYDHVDCVAVGSGPSKYCCTGTLIAPQIVVTAGHCYQDCAKYVLFGSSTKDPARRVAKVRKVIPHPEFGATETSVFNDLALLVLEEALDVKPRKIAGLETLRTASEAWIVGFGTTSADGTTGYGVRRFGGPLAFADETNPAFGANPLTEFVLARQPDGLDTCSGDSGGPVYVYSGGVEYVAGATSRAVPGATVACGEGGVYVKLSAYAEWLQQVAKSEAVAGPVIE